MIIPITPFDASILIRATAQGLQIECSKMPVMTMENIIANLNLAAKYIEGIQLQFKRPV